METDGRGLCGRSGAIRADVSPPKDHVTHKPAHFLSQVLLTASSVSVANLFHPLFNSSQNVKTLFGFVHREFNILKVWPDKTNGLKVPVTIIGVFPGFRIDFKLLLIA